VTAGNLVFDTEGTGSSFETCVEAMTDVDRSHLFYSVIALYYGKGGPIS